MDLQLEEKSSSPVQKLLIVQDYYLNNVSQFLCDLPAPFSRMYQDVSNGTRPITQVTLPPRDLFAVLRQGSKREGRGEGAEFTDFRGERLLSTSLSDTATANNSIDSQDYIMAERPLQLQWGLRVLRSMKGARCRPSRLGDPDSQRRPSFTVNDPLQPQGCRILRKLKEIRCQQIGYISGSKTKTQRSGTGRKAVGETETKRRRLTTCASLARLS